MGQYFVSQRRIDQFNLAVKGNVQALSPGLDRHGLGQNLFKIPPLSDRARDRAKQQGDHAQTPAAMQKIYAQLDAVKQSKEG